MSATRPVDELFLPEPEPRDGAVHGHLGRRPPRRAAAHVRGSPARRTSQDRAPRVIDTDDGHEVWEFDGDRFTQVGMNAIAGRRPETVKLEPFRFDQMRRGCWDIDARIHDMDINGVWASLNFPSMITGFCGRVFSSAPDPELGLAVTRAWNDWLFEEWYSPYPERIIPLRHHLPRPTRARRGRDPPQRRARLPVGDAARAAPPHRLAVDLHRLLGSDRRGVRRDRHRDQPARRLRPAGTTSPEGGP